MTDQPRDTGVWETARKTAVAILASLPVDHDGLDWNDTVSSVARAIAAQTEAAVSKVKADAIALCAMEFERGKLVGEATVKEGELRDEAAKCLRLLGENHNLKAEGDSIWLYECHCEDLAFTETDAWHDATGKAHARNLCPVSLKAERDRLLADLQDVNSISRLRSGLERQIAEIDTINKLSARVTELEAAVEQARQTIDNMLGPGSVTDAEYQAWRRTLAALTSPPGEKQ